MASAAAKPRVRVSTRGDVRGAVVNGEIVAPTPRSAYMRGGASPFFFGWNPALRESRDEVFSSYTMAAARAIDAMHNSGWIAGAVDQSIASTIGTELRLAAKPDRIALGWDAVKADEWSELVERRWVMWSGNAVECDAAGKMTIGQMSDAVLRGYFANGEALALLPMIRRSVSLTRTKVKLLPPQRLVQNTSVSERMFQGVTVDKDGMPISYRLAARDPFGSTAVYTGYQDVRARDGAGRPQVQHIFEGREGQMRGITPLAPALRTMRQYDQLSDVTLQAALIQAIFAATIQSEAPTEDILRSLQTEAEQDGDLPPMSNLIGARAAWYENSKIDLGGGGRITHLFGGDELKFNRSEHPNSTYEAFAKFLLREVARCLGMTFEQLTGDYSGATYSSVRMAGSEIWPIILRRRNMCARFLQAVYEAWLEEEIEEGRIPFPGGLMGFLAHRPAAVVASWRGPAKPQADDLKSAKAHEVYKRLGVVSDEMIADDLGHDIVDVYEQRSKEKALREKLGLPDGDTMTPAVDPEAEALLREPEAA